MPSGCRPAEDPAGQSHAIGTARRAAGARGVAAALGAACLLACRGGAPAESVRPSPAAPTTSPSPAEPGRLVGRWVRADADYTILVEEVSPGGQLRARYQNPGPINVSRAEYRRDEGKLRVLVELRDRGYPGSYYTLTYDPRDDSLFGSYHHLGLQEVFEVAFYRAGPEGTGGR